MKKVLLSIWSLQGGEQCLGNDELLKQPLTAFFASRQCPGIAIRVAMEWAIEQARSKNPVIGGFHSPLEQSVLKVLLTAGAPLVIVIARKLEQSHLPRPWIKAAQAGNAVVVGMDDTKRQLSAELALLRNEWVAGRADRIVVGYASNNGNLQQQARQWEYQGRNIQFLA